MAMNYNLFKNMIEKETSKKLHAEYRFHKTRKWRFDFAIMENMIAIEIEGSIWSNGRHTRGSGFIKDTEKYNTAASLGWIVLRFSSTEIYNSSTIEIIKKTIETREKK